MNVRQVIPQDAIPSVDDPEFGDDYFGDSDDEVIVVESEEGEESGESKGSDGSEENDGTEAARAYPVRILNYHEIVNDEFGDELLAVTWCPLCGSAVVYDRKVGDERLSFGVSGKLADDDLVMYDRETGSEWKQSLGEAFSGELAGQSLAVRTSAVTTYERFREEHPDGEVLQRPGGESEASGPGEDPEPIEYDDAPYADYFESEGFGLGAHRGEGGREWEREELDPKTVVLGIEAETEAGAGTEGKAKTDALGFALPSVERAGGVAQATVGEREVVVFATPDGIHAFENPGYEFEPADGEVAVFRADGTTWDGATGESDDGRNLERVAAQRLFAFAWQDDHGADAFWSE